MRNIFFGVWVMAGTLSAIAADPPTPDQKAQMEAFIEIPYPTSNATGVEVKRFMVMRAEVCERIRPYLKRLKTETAFMHCILDGYADAWRAAGAPNLDLTQLLVIGQFAIADRFDRHKVTEAEKEAELSELFTRVETQAKMRNSAAQQAAAAQQTAEAQQRAAEARQQLEIDRLQQEVEAADRQRRANAYQWLNKNLLTPQQPTPSTTMTCMPFGAGVKCTSQ